MSDGLCHALLDYNNLVESNKEKFNQYLDQLQQYEKDLIPLQIDYAYAVMIRLEPAAGVSISVNGTWVNTVSGKWTMLTRSKGTDSVTVNSISLGEYETSSNEATIVDRYSLDQKKNQISLKEVEISNLNSKIIAVKQQITQLQTLLTAENNFSSEQLQELNYFVIEREFNEDKYIDEKDLYEAALEKFKELQVPQLSVDIDIVNFLEIVEEQLNWDKLNLGDYVNVKYESVGIGVTARISEIQYDYDSSSISLTLSNIKNVNDESTRIEKFLNETKNTSIIVDTNKTKWGQAVVDSSDMSKLLDRFWNKVTNEINMSINNTVDINNKGITITDPDDPLRFLRLTNGALGLTRSGGLRYETAITADGLIAEMVLGKIILGQRVVIGDTTGVFTIEGSRLMIDDRCGREVVKLGLLSDQPDRFGFFLNRYGSSNCNDTTKVNRVSMTAEEGFIIERFRNGIADKTFGTSLDGDLFVKAGVDDQVFTIDKNGLALGSSVWARAPFHADYYGNVWMNKLYADSAEIQNSMFKNGRIEGSSLTLRDGAGVMKMFPLKGFWAGAEEFEDAVASIAMDGTAKFKKLKITDNQNTLLIDSEQRKIFMNQWDIVGKVSTLTRAAVQGWSNYIKIEGKELTFLTSMVEAGTGYREPVFPVSNGIEFQDIRATNQWASTTMYQKNDMAGESGDQEPIWSTIDGTTTYDKNAYNDPLTIIARKGDATDPFVDRTDSLPVINGMITLLEIPSSTDKVVIGGFVEIDQRVYEKHQMLKENEFLVHYGMGTIQFHPSQEGKVHLCRYKGRGLIMYPASRIYAMITRNPDVIKTLQDFIDESQRKLDETQLAMERVEGAIQQSIDQTGQAKRATDHANDAADEALEAANRAKDAYKTTRLVYKSPVADLRELWNTYPFPEIGWTVQTYKDGKRRRYDGNNWIEIDVFGQNLQVVNSYQDGLMSVAEHLKLNEIPLEVDSLGETDLDEESSRVGKDFSKPIGTTGKTTKDHSGTPYATPLTPGAKEILGVNNNGNPQDAAGNYVTLSIQCEVPLNAKSGKQQFKKRISYRYV
ncbi:unnamed protein product, partial [Mesorhabditis spiculigera]